MYAIVLNNHFCINTLNKLKVLLKSVQADRQCLDKGSFSKMTSFSLENEYLVLVKIGSLQLNSSNKGHDPLLQQKLHHSDVELKAHNVAQRSWESAPIRKGEQHKAVKDSEVALNDPGFVTSSFHNCSIGLRMGLLD